MATMSMKRQIAAAILAFGALTATRAFARVIYVDADSTVAGLGTSWQDAHLCLQAALSRADSGDVIRVAQGTYRPNESTTNSRWPELRISTDRTAAFLLVSGVKIQGGYAGRGEADPNARDIHRYETILSGDLKRNDGDLESLDWATVNDYTLHPSRNDNSYTVVTASNADAATVLDGFTITGGNTQGLTGGMATGGSAFRNNRGFPTIIDCTFRLNTARAEGVGGYQSWGFRGGAIVSIGGQPTFRNCVFTENICFTNSGSGFGGAAYNDESHTIYIDCVFERNVASGSEKEAGGGAVCNHRSHPSFTNCTFRGNVALRCRGSCLYDFVNSDAVLTGCRFEDNVSDYGGAVYNLTSNPKLTDCLFVANKAVNSGPGGAIVNDTGASPTLTNCRFLGNTAQGGGAVYSGWNSKPVLVGCLFSGNRATLGAGIYNNNAQPRLVNCTFSGNIAGDKGGAVYSVASSTSLTNCILWGNPPEEMVADPIRTASFHSIVQGGWPGVDNRDTNPLFVDADGPDDVAGTEDDDLRLLAGSSGLDAGENSAAILSTPTDLDGGPRIENGTVDIGAYEGALTPPVTIYHVNGAGGNDNGNGLSPETAFATIQKGINSASDGCIVLVHPGLYAERIDFQGKAITVAGAGDAAVISIPGGDAVSFYNGEGSNSSLRNFVIVHNARGIFVVGSSPTIRHVTFVDNGYGVAAYLGARPSLSNCIFWQNFKADLLGCAAAYSRTQDAGEGNIDADPLFADPNAGDYHLRSQRGRYRPSTDEWVLDRVTSPCVDAGDPTADPSQEPMPNGARIDMGAYGATPFASMSEWPIRADMNYDGKVNLIDLAWMADAWLWTSPWAP